MKRTASRVGGDEFAAIATVKTLSEAEALSRHLAERIKLASGITASIGATMRQIDEPFNVTIDRADAALDQVKGSGRDAVMGSLRELT